MLKSVEGVYRDGRVELTEIPDNLPEQTKVIVTFLDPGNIDLQARGFDATQAADLRARLSSFNEDWESAEMSIYDDYDNAKGQL